MSSEVRYQKVPLQGPLVRQLHEHARAILPKGSVIVPFATARALGGGDLEVGQNILHRMFRMSAALAVHPDAIRELGAGSIVKGRRVIEAFLKRAHELYADGGGEHARGGAVDDDVPQEEAPSDARVKLAGDVVLFPFVEPAVKDWSGRYGASSGDELLKRLTRNSLSKALGGVENVTPLPMTPHRASGGDVHYERVPLRRTAGERDDQIR